ncbi:sulfatase [Parabacteroides sp. OttesenSCG-928-N08]|nr:sulfatase [Parabacteroides sp. OttesenSCG-928-N08]
MKTCTVITALLAGSAISLTAQNKPNLVLFMSDDCSFYDLGCYGNEASLTPNIDRFASEGIRFTKAYQAVPMSSPTRHNLYTGLWPVRTGAYPNHTFAKEGTKSIVHHLQPAGYKVALIGKSHVNPESVFPWDLYVNLDKKDEIIFSAVDSFIKDCNATDTPFCLFVMSKQPHTPWNKGNPALFDPDEIPLPPFYVDIPETRKDMCRYLAEINYMDGEFGTLLNTLKRHQVEDNSVVVYLSEQGNSHPFAKWTCYDVGVHSACIVRWPKVIQPHTTSDAIVEYVDIVPTFLEIAQADPVAPLDGKSFVPVLKGEKNTHKQYTFSMQTTRGIYSGSDFYGIRSVADNCYRYIVNLTPEETFKNTEVIKPFFKKWLEMAENDPMARWITYKYQHRPAIELYNIQEDPHCMTNIAGLPESQPIIERMSKELANWMDYCGDKGQETEMEALEHQYRNENGRIGE